VEEQVIVIIKEVSFYKVVLVSAVTVTLMLTCIGIGMWLWSVLKP
jgi:cell division protein FtsX